MQIIIPMSVRLALCYGVRNGIKQTQRSLTDGERQRPVNNQVKSGVKQIQHQFTNVTENGIRQIQKAFANVIGCG